MQNTKNLLHDAAKEERGIDWQEASHGGKAVSPASVPPHTAQASKGLVQLTSSLTARLCCQRTPAHTAVNGQMEKPVQKYKCSSRPTANHMRL